MTIKGVYAIKAANGMMYIGSSIGCINRKSSHFALLRKNKHTNKNLQAEYNLKGLAFFSFVILEEVSLEIDLKSREQAWIDDAISRCVAYNVCEDARSTRGISLSQSTKDKMSNSQRGSIKSSTIWKRARTSATNREKARSKGISLLSGRE